MPGTLDITPLRSFVAVADNGGFQRAADALHLSQAAVSQHVRRLELAVGRRLFERDGRSSRFTHDGEALLGYARRLLELHDRTLAHFLPDEVPALAIGSTEHAAAQLLPALTGAMGSALLRREVRLRLDRGVRLREDLAAGRLDLAILPGPTANPELDRSASALTVGSLELTWYAAPGWRLPGDGTVPIVVFESPCALRVRAVETLNAHGLSPSVVGEAVQLAGVQAAAAAGVGVALMATLGQVPTGLVEVEDLPPVPPLEFAVWGRSGLDPELLAFVAEALGRTVAAAPRAERGVDVVV
ncbi:LysR family transcriptional regulator [Nocardioides houyundeii]|uniref:LysR family transcriptional regulator n=1 Tax=Nocardioides houyundeii TaxID=2045452 RepID=UPI000DF481BD|nr:LysR family transcriptional regulator [Nocardioides houyundeii]